MDDDVLNLAKRLYAAMNDEDVEPFLALCARDVILEYPASGRLPYGGTWSGRHAAEEFLTAHDAAEEILRFDPAEMYAAGDVVCVLGMFEGRAKDTDLTWTTTFVHILSFEHGLLTRWRSFFDTAAAIEAHSGRV